MKRSYQVALGGVTCALGVIFMVLSYYFQIGDLPLMALSSLMLLMPLKKGMFKTAGLCYVAVSLLTFLLTGYFVAIIPYLVFFGLHPIEIALFDRYRIHRVLQALIKLIHCNAALFVIFTFTTIFVTTGEGFPLWAYYLVGNLTFFLYDWLIVRIYSKLNYYLDRIFRS